MTGELSFSVFYAHFDPLFIIFSQHLGLATAEIYGVTARNVTIHLHEMLN